MEILTQLNSFCDATYSEIIYDSDIHPMNRNHFAFSVAGRHNVGIIIITDKGYSFGSYVSQVPQIPTVKRSSISEGKSFIFTLNSPTIPPTKFERTDYCIPRMTVDQSLEIYKYDKSESIRYNFAINYAFGFWDNQLFKDESGYLYFGIEGSFVGKPTHEDLTGIKQRMPSANSYFPIARIVVVQFY
ncbi:hypothetical protein EIN_423420 [Entamoeba invadens IP1]|uniref:TLDc domain-containing protein n=1 Tax=Entamoeba invadens IP1 TaxID=370355 RepID=A0A0A1UCY8_ENTIV|nr:hypothetical protein EIN_423420 [Entamoeba invadens IP1]ELP94291.1 hypothetical protein EIN_423420 [Entamoeba invadens IP1]|eukprot:XP_004261062.1 hypothetical protein EIN_423420 [Entamoeba invadens IP1]